MTRKEKTQQNRYDTKIAPLIEELTKLCKKFEMPMLVSVQLFENELEGARVATHIAQAENMSLPMSLGSSIMNGSTEVRITDDNCLQLAVPKEYMPDKLQPYKRGWEDDCDDSAEVLELIKDIKNSNALFVIPKKNHIH